MLKSILSALVSGLKACARLAANFLTAPLRLFGGGSLALPEISQIEAPRPHVPPPEDRTKLYEDVARAIMNWAADSVIADRPVDLPPRLPIVVREWLPGLSRDECMKLMESDTMFVSGHVRRESLIPGVRPVQQLPRVAKWPAELREPESTGFAAIAAPEQLDEPARA